jgi:hypothetical protein
VCVQILLVREFQLLARNKQLVVSHIFGDIFMGLVIGSLFFNLDRTDFQVRLLILLVTASHCV